MKPCSVLNFRQYFLCMEDTTYLPAIINMMPEVRVILAFAESSIVPIRMHFIAKMHTKRPRMPRTMPTIIRALTA